MTIKTSPAERIDKESAIERKCKLLAKEKGWLSYKFTSPNHRAVPDRIFIKNLNIIFIEFKAPGKIPTALQEHEMDILRSAGMRVYVVDNVEFFAGIIDSHDSEF